MARLPKDLPDIRDLFKKHKGKRVKIWGRMYTVGYREDHVIYPYKHLSREIWLDPVNKNSTWYRDIRRKLGDDWVTDAWSVTDEKQYPEMYLALLHLGAAKRRATPGARTVRGRR